MAEHVRIGNILPRIQYVGNDAATQFVFPFPIFGAADLEIYFNGERQWDGFTVEGAGNSHGGTVTFTGPPPEGTLVTLRRNLVLERLTDFQESGEFRAKAINDELDYQVAALQDLSASIATAVRLSPTDEAMDLTLPGKAERAGKVLGFGADGDLTVREAAAGGGTGETGGSGNHGGLTGLGDDDHPQYLTSARANAWLSGKTSDDLREGSANRYMRLAGTGTATTAARADHTHTGTYEPAFQKNTAFNKNLGTTAGTVAEGNHSHSLDDLANVDESGKAEGYALVWSSVSNRWQPGAVSGGGSGGGGGLLNAYIAMTDGTNSAAASGGETFRVRSSTGSITPLVGSDATHGDNIDINVVFGGTGAATTAARSDHTHDGTYEPAFNKNTAFNKNFGTTVGTVAAGDHGHQLGDVAGLPAPAPADTAKMLRVDAAGTGYELLDAAGTRANLALGSAAMATLGINPGQVPAIQSDGKLPSAVLPAQAGSAPATLIVQDRKPSGTDGGTFLAGGWRTRDLNTVVANTISGASLGDNRIALPAGTYEVEGSAPAQTGSAGMVHRARLINTASSTIVALGSNESSGYGVGTRSVFLSRFTLASTATLELQHYTTADRQTDGFGKKLSLGMEELYSVLRFSKVG